MVTLTLSLILIHYNMASILSSLLGRQYTIGELMKIDAVRQLKAATCSVSLIQVYHEIKKESILDKFKKFFKRSSSLFNLYYIILKLQVISDTGGTHIVYIRTTPDFNLSNFDNNKVQIYCSCKDFMYRSAYLLERRGSLFRSKSTDMALGTAITESPKAKSGTTLLCKHSYAALVWLMSNYTGIMKSL